MRFPDLEEHFGEEKGKKLRRILKELYLHDRFFTPEELSLSTGLPPEEVEHLLLEAKTAGLVVRYKRPAVLSFKYRLADPFRPKGKSRKRKEFLVTPFSLHYLKSLLDLLASSYPSLPPSALLEKAVNLIFEAGGPRKAIRRLKVAEETLATGRLPTKAPG